VEVCIEVRDEGVGGHHLGGASDGHQVLISVELRGDDAFQDVVHGVNPVHENPEVGEVAGDDHEAAEEGEQRQHHAPHHCARGSGVRYIYK